MPESRKPQESKKGGRKRKEKRTSAYDGDAQVSRVCHGVGEITRATTTARAVLVKRRDMTLSMVRSSFPGSLASVVNFEIHDLNAYYVDITYGPEGRGAKDK